MAAKMIPVGDAHSIAADEFAEVFLNCNRDVVARLRDGKKITVLPGYGQTPWQRRDELVRLINAAMDDN